MSQNFRVSQPRGRWRYFDTMEKARAAAEEVFQRTGVLVAIEAAPKKERPVFEQHQRRVARGSLRMPGAMLGVMGGPSKAEAKRILGPTETARVLRETVKLPKKTDDIERFVAHGQTLEVKKLRHDYFAIVVGQQRGRFGNAEQIREDIAHFVDTGVLPRSKTNY